MSRYWLISKQTESLLCFRTEGDLLIFLYNHQGEVARYRVLKNKNDHVVEVHLSHLKWSEFREVLERS